MPPPLAGRHCRAERSASVAAQRAAIWGGTPASASSSANCSSSLSPSLGCRVKVTSLQCARCICDGHEEPETSFSWVLIVCLQLFPCDPEWCARSISAARQHCNCAAAFAGCDKTHWQKSTPGHQLLLRLFLHLRRRHRLGILLISVVAARGLIFRSLICCGRCRGVCIRSGCG